MIALTSPAASLSPLSSRWASALCQPWSAAARRSPPFIWNSDPRSPRNAAMSADRRISLFGSSTSSFQMDGGRCRATALQGRRTAIALNSRAARLSPLSNRWASALCQPWSAAARRSTPFIWNSDPRSPRNAAMSADRRISLFGSSTSSFEMDGGRCRATALQGRQAAIGPNSPAASLSPLSSRWASALCLLAVGEPMGVSPRTIRSHH